MVVRWPWTASEFQIHMSLLWGLQIVVYFAQGNVIVNFLQAAQKFLGKYLVRRAHLVEGILLVQQARCTNVYIGKRPHLWGIHVQH